VWLWRVESWLGRHVAIIRRAGTQELV
jgi:hypothetical protein